MLGVVDTLVGTGRDELLAISPVTFAVLLVLSSTAANGKQPEESASNAESNSNPSRGKEPGVKVSLHTVEFRKCFDSSGRDGGLGSGHDRGNDDGGGGESGHNVCAATSKSAKDRNDSENQFQDGQKDSDDVDNASPLVNVLEGGDSGLDVLGDCGVAVGCGSLEGLVNLSDVCCVGCPVEFRLCASSIGTGSTAIIPQTNPI